MSSIGHRNPVTETDNPLHSIQFKTMLPGYAGSVSICLQQVTMLTHLSPAFDKGCTLGFAILSGVAAMAVLTVCPEGVLSFDTKLATQTLSQATGALIRNKASTEAGKVLPHSFQTLYTAALCKQSVSFTLA